MSRKRIILGILLLFLVGCSEPKDEEGTKQDDSNIKTSIIGHWRNIPSAELDPKENTETDYYISESKLIMIEPGVRREMDYRVVGAKQKENWIRLELNSTTGSHIKTFIFKDSSRKSFTEALDMRDYQIKGDSEADKQLDNVL